MKESRATVPDTDTIAAVATPLGQAGIGVIRISGPRAPEVGRSLFRPTRANCTWQSHHAYHGDILTADGKTILDEVLVTLMRKPHSFTGEDVLEISGHGNPVILQTILEQLIILGCRPAHPGEFSRRAFLNGRMDLSQAEALAAMISAQSAKAFAISLAQLKGSLGREIEQIRMIVIDALAGLEAAIDFSDDVGEDETPAVPPEIADALTAIDRLLSTCRQARLFTEGLSCIITGKPNVGKSSLLNALTGKKKAIVTDIPGTTRDLITETITINGLCVHVTDTAGIRAPQDIIEKEGIDLVRESLTHADVIVIVLDGSKPLTDDDRRILAENKSRADKVLLAVNKSDLPRAWTPQLVADTFSSAAPLLNISAKFGVGLESLKQSIASTSGADDTSSADGMIMQMRHKLALEKALANLKAARENLKTGQSPEFAAFELREAVDALDEITGRKIHEEVLDKIFSSFCIGK